MRASPAWRSPFGRLACRCSEMQSANGPEDRESLQAANSILRRGVSGGEETILEVRDLTVALQVDNRVIQPVDGISFRLERGRTLAMVGESGSGKSMTALAIVGLLPRGLAHVTRGQVLLAGE